MKRLLLALALFCSVANAQIIQHQISDDGYARVPLQFAFPYYGRVFTESYMFSNGVVGFMNPDYNSWCCTGFDLRTNNGTPFNFAIMPLQTDLLNYSGRFLTEGTPQYQRYKWENISEFGAPQNLNTFGVEIRPSGYIGMHYEQVNISSWRPVTIGMTGDTSLGEYTQHYHGAGFVDNIARSFITESTGNVCLSNPLASHSCPNYQQAYHDQQCSINPLYAQDCAGYEQAYYNQQCSLNPLYDRNCIGYAEAYAVANVVSTTTLQVSAPQLVVSTTGAVSVQTPIIADPVVNEVVTRPAPEQRPEPRQEQRQEQLQEPKKEDKKAEKKEDSKDDKKPTQRSVRVEKIEQIKTQGVAIQAPAIASVDLPKGVDIVDYSFMKIIANMKPIRENRNLGNMMQHNDRIHREMVDEQYRR